MNGKLLFLDIDGTLTEPGYNVPPASALDAIRKAQKNGHKVYLCSGRNKAMLKPLLAYGFDGYVVSYEVGCSKKDGVIYDILLEKYGLNGSECVFIDDVQKNVDIGEEHGIPGILYAGVEPLRAELASRGIL